MQYFPMAPTCPQMGQRWPEMALARLPFCLQVTPGWSSMLDLACKNLSDASCLENVFLGLIRYTPQTSLNKEVAGFHMISRPSETAPCVDKTDSCFSTLNMSTSKGIALACEKQPFLWTTCVTGYCHPK